MYSRILQLVYSYLGLQSIPPTSVAERAFSAAGTHCRPTKIRSRLSDATLDTMCFLLSIIASGLGLQALLNM